VAAVFRVFGVLVASSVVVVAVVVAALVPAVLRRTRAAPVFPTLGVRAPVSSVTVIVVVAIVMIILMVIIIIFMVMTIFVLLLPGARLELPREGLGSLHQVA